MLIRNISYINWFLPVYIIFAQFKVFTVFSNYALILTTFASIYYIFLQNGKLRVFKPIVIIFFLGTLAVFINTVRLQNFTPSTLNNLIEIFLLSLNLAVHSRHFVLEDFYKIYGWVGLVSSLIIVVQGFLLFTFQIPSVPINILPLEASQFNFWDDFLGRRPSGLFAEPQSFASYILPLILLNFHYRDYKRALFHSIAIVFSTSTLGLGVLVILLLKSSKLISGAKRYYIIALITLLTVSILLLFPGLTEFIVSKIGRINIENNIRLTRGFLIYFELSLIDKVLGIGYTITDFVLKNISEPWVDLYVINGNERLLGYVTSFSGNFIRFGIFFGLYYNYFLFKNIRNENLLTSNIAFLIFVLSVGQTITFNAWYFFYFLILFGLLRANYND